MARREGPAAHLPEGVRTLLDAAGSAVVVVDSAGRVRYVNDRVRDLLGHDAAEVLGEPVETLLPPELHGVHREHRAAYQRERQPILHGVSRPLRGRRRDGAEVPLQIHLTPLEVEGEPWTVAALVDVGPRVRDDERLRRLSRDYRTLAALNEVIIRATDSRALFQQACEVAVQEGGYLGAFVGEPWDEGRVEPVATAGAIDDYVRELGIVLDPDDPHGQGPVARAFRESRSLYTSDFLADPSTAPWRTRAAATGIRAAAMLPLRRGGETVAVIALYADRPDVFDEHTRFLLEQLAANLSYALEGFATTERQHRLATERAHLLERLVSAQEGERARIAADVHDEPVQALAVVDLELGMLRRRLERSPAEPEVATLVAQVQHSVADATASLRDLLFDLDDQDGDWVEGVRAAGVLLERQGVDCVVEAGRAADLGLSGVAASQTLRIVKEALVNVRKHARASRVVVTAERAGDGVMVTVTDDGRGLGQGDRGSRAGHRGLETMTDRAAVAGGWLCVESPPEGGTRVAVWVPAAF